MKNKQMQNKHPKHSQKEKIKEKITATIVGCAVGDSLGMPVEGWRCEQIKKYVDRVEDLIDPVIIRDKDGTKVTQDEFGKLKYFTEEFRAGEYTDDTILTLALAESIIAKEGLDLDDAAHRQLEAYTLRRRFDGTVKGGFGSTTIDAFKRLEAGISPLESGVIGGPGNGPAMKMSPVGIYAAVTGKYEESLRFAEQFGRVTHRDPRSIASGIVMAHAVHAVLNEASRAEFVESIACVCAAVERPLTPEYTWWKQGTLTSRLNWIEKNKNVTCEDAFKQLGSSSAVYQSFPFALFMFQKLWDDPVTGLIETVNYGGDCDTTGAMYGALAGARHGMVFPPKWFNKLHNLDYLVSVSERLHSLRTH